MEYVATAGCSIVCTLIVCYLGLAWYFRGMWR
jgi:hypothetical protein